MSQPPFILRLSSTLCFNAILVQVLSWVVIVSLDRMYGTKMVRYAQRVLSIQD